MSIDVQYFRELEESLLDPDVRRSPDRLGALIADDFVEIGSSGRTYRKADVLDASSTLPDVAVPLDDFAAEETAPGAVLVTYRSTTRCPDGSTREALRSSLWVRRGDRWQMRFHHGTPVAPPSDCDR